MTKVLISGSRGKLATHLVEQSKETEYSVMSLDRKTMDITERRSLATALDEHKPDIFIHAAAYTRPMNKHQKNANISLETNVVGTANVVLECMSRGIKLVYISTDYVYPGAKGKYSEDEPLSPYIGNNDGVTKYGWSKLGGECAVRMYDGSLILRVCMCNYPFPHAKAAIDIKKSLMYDYEAAEVVLQLLGEKGTINVGGPSQSVYDFARQKNPKISKLSRKDIGDVLIAPDTSMNTSKMKSILRGKNE
jgi:dTDP-4-dehydrorhamnose reductase|tara:strand:+ start:186 stop:932 length:747 start_codon:yes stop_codon:yes gene_type:complete